MVFSAAKPPLLALLLGLTGSASLCGQAVRPAEPAPAPAAPQPPEEEVVKVSPVEVRARNDDPGFDATGMGSYEQQLRDSPFSNDLISAESLEDDPGAMEIQAELVQIANPSAVDLATGDSRVALRGFPSPLLRNGFTTMGSSDMLNTTRTIVIQGALVPVLGRAAPGGIQDFITARPRAAAGKRFEYSLSSLRRQSALLEVTGPTVPNRVWHRFASDWSRRKGPEPHTATDTRSVNTAVTWRHNSAASTLFAFDFQQTRATAAGGTPEYRRFAGDRIVGPYLPLAGFNAVGPLGGVRRRTAAASVLFDGQPHPRIAVRAGVETWMRRIEQDRFTTSLYNVALGRFEGIREPIHSEQPMRTWLAHLEATGRFRRWRAEHKVMLAASHTWTDALREEFGLTTAGRNALPATVRNFDPLAPDYYRPPFSRDLYSRVITDRRDRGRYASFEASERAGFAQGLVVLTAGLRQDLASVRIHDRRPGAPRAQYDDRTSRLTYHSGVNYQAIPSRLLLFLTASTAFEPSMRVDARTGRIQGNESTRGLEGGLKARLPAPDIDLTLTAFSLFNQNILRRNPLYNDPIRDANQTQPQLVASGEETFRGAKLEGRWRITPLLAFGTRVTYTRAVTTASPDLPEEVGRELTRYPPFNASATLSYAFGPGRWQGLSCAYSWSYISGYVAAYEDRQRYALRFPGYPLSSLSVNYSFRKNRFLHGVGLALRNLFDYDLVKSQARVGAGIELAATYRLMF